MKFRPVGAELFHAEGRTDETTDGQTDGRKDGRTDGHADMTKLNVPFRIFAKAPNKGKTQKTCIFVIN